MLQFSSNEAIKISQARSEHDTCYYTCPHAYTSTEQNIFISTIILNNILRYKQEYSKNRSSQAVIM